MSIWFWNSLRISSLFVLDQVVSDNAMISIYPLGKDLYAFAETPFIHRIDPVTMETTRRVSRASKSMKQLKYLPVIVWRTGKPSRDAECLQSIVSSAHHRERRSLSTWPENRSQRTELCRYSLPSRRSRIQGNRTSSRRDNCSVPFAQRAELHAQFLNHRFLLRPDRTAAKCLFQDGFE